MAMVTLSQGAGAAMVILNTAVQVAQNSVAAAQNALGMTYQPLANSTLLGNSTGMSLPIWDPAMEIAFRPKGVAAKIDLSDLLDIVKVEMQQAG
jgi:hypothetical protein